VRDKLIVWSLVTAWCVLVAVLACLPCAVQAVAWLILCVLFAGVKIWMSIADARHRERGGPS